MDAKRAFAVRGRMAVEGKWRAGEGGGEGNGRGVERETEAVLLLARRRGSFAEGPRFAATSLIHVHRGGCIMPVVARDRHLMAPNCHDLPVAVCTSCLPGPCRPHPSGSFAPPRRTGWLSPRLPATIGRIQQREGKGLAASRGRVKFERSGVTGTAGAQGKREKSRETAVVSTISHKT